MVPKPLNLTDDEAAYLAWQWAQGVTQYTLGRRFGCTNVTVSLAIRYFLEQYLPPSVPRDITGSLPWRIGRRQLVERALTVYMESHEGKVRIRLRAA